MKLRGNKRDIPEKHKTKVLASLLVSNKVYLRIEIITEENNFIL